MSNRCWPLPKNQINITSRFAGRINPITGRAENHSGVDFAAPDGTPFHAVADGTVQYIGPASGYGQWIVIDHPAEVGGGCSEYGHMWDAYATGHKVGDKVRKGQVIGYIGSNGQSTGAHLHLTIWEYGYGGRRVDPETWLAGADYPGQPASKVTPTPQVKGNPVRERLDWTRRFGFGKPRPTTAINHICIHVTVNAPGTPCENVANYQINSETGSYHQLTDTNARVLVENTDDWNVWAAGPTSNWSGLHRSFLMRGSETRDQWLKYEAMLRAGAYEDAKWAKAYNIPPVKLSAAELRAGKRGFVGHSDTAAAWRETDHTDPGPGFPWDTYLGYVREYMGTTTKIPTPKQGGPLMALTDAEQTELLDKVRRIHHELTHPFQSRYRDTNGTQSEFRDTMIGYILEADRKLEDVHHNMLPTIAAHLPKTPKEEK